MLRKKNIGYLLKKQNFKEKKKIRSLRKKHRLLRKSKKFQDGFSHFICLLRLDNSYLSQTVPLSI